MPFRRDERYAAEVGRIYGEYLATYSSSSDQVRAYLFRQPDGHVEAHVSFRGGVLASGVTDSNT